MYISKEHFLLVTENDNVDNNTPTLSNKNHASQNLVVLRAMPQKRHCSIASPKIYILGKCY